MLKPMCLQGKPPQRGDSKTLKVSLPSLVSFGAPNHPSKGPKTSIHSHQCQRWAALTCSQVGSKTGD